MENIKFVQDLQRQIYMYMYQKFSHIVILCIGTNKLIGDCVGPMVGEKLKERIYCKEVVIYGDMKETVNFKNAKQVIESILKRYEKPFIITIDSALGKENMIRKIAVSAGWIQIGNATGRCVCYYSHMNIKGIVDKYRRTPQENVEALERVNPQLVIELSNIVAKGIEKIIQEIEIVN